MRYFFTDKTGGVSQPPYESLNLGLHVGDDAQRVLRNRMLVQEKIGAKKCVFMNQVHGDEVVIIETGDETPTCDALITHQKGIALAVMVADCMPILLYDDATQVIGVAHAGREGTKLGVAQTCALKMREYFGASFSSLKVMMGPSIHGCCYEVGEEAIVGLERVVELRDGRYFLDLQRFNYEAFLAMGIREENIERSSTCTCCSNTLFSYRREKVTGRFAGVISL